MKSRHLFAIGIAAGVVVASAKTVVVTPEAKWSYSEATPGVFTDNFTNAVEKGENKGVIYDVATDATISGTITSQYGGLVKLGAGTLTLSGVNNLSMAMGSKDSIPNADNQLTLDGTGNHATAGFGALSVLEGRLVVTNAKTTIKQLSSRFAIGGHVAAVGEVEKDVYVDIVNGGTIESAVAGYLGGRHGFVNNTAEGRPAIAALRIYPGGKYSQGGGKAFYFGGQADTPNSSTWGVFNSDLRLEVPGGTFTAGTSYAGFLVAQYNGQTSTISVTDGGSFIDYLFETGYKTSANGANAPLTIDVSGTDSSFRVQYFVNNVQKKSGPVTTINVHDGATFRCDQMDARENGTLNISLDNATVSTYGILNTHIATERKVVFPAEITSLTLGAGGATLISYGTATNPASNKMKLPITAVFAKGFASSPDLPEGTPDGGLVLKGDTPTNVIEIAGASTYSGPTVLESGTLTFSGDGALPASGTFTQKGGTLFASSKDITLGNAEFQYGATIKLAHGRRLVVNGDVSIANGVKLVLLDENGAEATETVEAMPFMTVPAANVAQLENLRVPRKAGSLRLSSKSVTVDGGMATLAVTYSVPGADTSDTWTGGEASDSASIDGNWKSGVAPSLQGGTLLATFAEGGSQAIFPGESDLRGIVFSGGDFFIGSAVPGARLVLGSAGLSFAEPGEGETPEYTIGLPVAVESAQTWTVPSGVSVVLTNEVTATDKIKVPGAGRVEFRDGGQFANLSISNVTAILSGRICNIDGTVSDVIKDTTDPGVLVTRGALSSAYTTIFSNAVVEKCFYSNQGNMGYTAFVVATNSTCTFKGGVHVTIPWKEFRGQPGSECVFENGAKLDWTVKFGGSGSRFVIRNKPMAFDANAIVLAATVRFECAGNSVGNSYQMRLESTGRLELAVDNVFNNTALNIYNEKGTIDLCGTRQPFKFVLSAGNKATITGEAGSLLEVTQGTTVMEGTAGSTNICCKVQGGVGLLMSGTGRLLMKGMAFESSGDVSVSNGVLEFASDASWLNGTNVTVSGTGTLKIGKAETFSKDFAVIHFEDSGMISVPAGMTQVFAEGWDGDRKLTSGKVYSSENLPGRIAGGGAIRIAGGGFAVYLR